MSYNIKSLTKYSINIDFNLFYVFIMPVFAIDNLDRLNFFLLQSASSTTYHHFYGPNYAKREFTL